MASTDPPVHPSNGPPNGPPNGNDRPPDAKDRVAAGPPEGDDWVGLTTAPLPLAEALAWATTPDTGGQVLFSGTVRDHAEGRTGVTWLEYEAYTEQVEPKLSAIAAAARGRWPMLGRVVLLHRIGRLQLTECSVVVVVSSPHRPEAFEAARFCIDTLKATVPIWKRESWEGGTDWGTGAHDVETVGGQVVDAQVVDAHATGAEAGDQAAAAPGSPPGRGT